MFTICWSGRLRDDRIYHLARNIWWAPVGPAELGRASVQQVSGEDRFVLKAVGFLGHGHEKDGVLADFGM